MRSIITVLALCLSVSGALEAQVTVIQSPSGRGLALVEARDGYRVEDPNGPSRAVEVPPETVLSAFEELAEGWIAAGIRFTDRGSELFLVRGTATANEPIRPPEKTAPAFHKAPVLLIEAGRLAGLAWLEGDGGENNAVMASEWTGDAWQAVEAVSPYSGGAQLALSGAVLDDGSSLLVWAAVVGEDDEILWSRLETGAWSAPELLHPDNEVADIVPRLAPVAGAALAAWSQYDGKDYRLRVARFADGAWIDTGFSSEEGAAYPTRFSTPHGAGFLYQVATPRSWALIDLGPEGQLRRRAATGRLAGQTRPLVFADPSSTVELRFSTGPADQAAFGPSGQVTLGWIVEP